MGAHHGNNGNVNPHGRGEVDVAPLREAVLRATERAGESLSDLAVRLNYFDGPRGHGRRPSVDVRRLKRELGLAPYGSRGKTDRVRQMVTHDVAERIARAANLDPWEVGI